MTYLDDVDSELQQAGIPTRRRQRILTEFADHLREDPGAELGALGRRRCYWPLLSQPNWHLRLAVSRCCVPGVCDTCR